MHGLTGNHDASTALAHAAHPAAAMPPNTHHAAPQPSLHVADHQMPAANPPAVAAPFAPTPADVVPSSGITVQTAPNGHGHAMGDVCLAKLTALALAILAALAVRSLRGAHPVLSVSPALAAIAAGPAAPWLQPTLSKLCVLRT
jgi:hypothetical protein